MHRELLIESKIPRLFCEALTSFIKKKQLDSEISPAQDVYLTALKSDKNRMKEKDSPLVRVENLTKSFSKNQVLRGVNLCLKPGNFYALLGRNGAGKSTLMKIMMRTETKDQGTVEMLGSSLDEDRPKVFQRIGFVSESIEYPSFHSIESFFGQVGKLYPHFQPKALKKTIDIMGIDDRSAFHNLSRGQKMQTSFAFALSIQPKLLLLDEITSVLDLNARGYFMDRLHEYVKKGGTILMATNLILELHQNSDHLILLHQGKVSLDLPMKDLSQHYLKLKKTKTSRNTIFRNPHCVPIQKHADGTESFLIAKKDIPSSQIKALDRIKKTDISAEDLFIYFNQPRGAKS